MSELTSGIIIAVVTAVATYLLTDRSKKKEYLYQNRIAAFKEVFKAVAEIKRFASGQIALQLGNETAPYFDEPGSPLSLRETLARSREENNIFLTNISRQKLDNLDAILNGFANGMLGRSNSNGTENYDIDYTPLYEAASETEQIIYNELGLPQR